MDRIFKLQEVAEILDVHANTVKIYIRDEKIIPCAFKNGRYLFSYNGIKDYYKDTPELWAIVKNNIERKYK